MRRASLFLIAALLFLAPLLPRPSAAAWPTDPLVNVPLCTAAGNQQNPVSISDGGGGVIVAWEDYRGGSGNGDIYAQRISSQGTAQWGANGVPLCTLAGGQSRPTIVTDDAGGAIVTWADCRNGSTNCDIYAQRIGWNGEVQWSTNGVPICTAAGGQSTAISAPDGMHGAVITWVDNRSSSAANLYAQRVSPLGAVQWPGNGVPLCNTEENPRFPAITPDGLGGGIVVWEEGGATRQPMYRAQRISAGGTLQWADCGVVVGGSLMDLEPAIVSDGAGGAVIAYGQGAFPGSIGHAARLTANGTIQWDVRLTGLGCFYGPAPGDYCFLVAPMTIAADGTGGAIVSFIACSDNYSCRALNWITRVSGTGEIEWMNREVPVTQPYTLYPLLADNAGGAILVWNDFPPYLGASWITGGAYTNGATLSTASGNKASPGIVTDGAGGAIVTWQDTRNGSTNGDIYSQQVNHAGQVGGPPAHVITATAGQHGSIMPTGWVPVATDANKTFSITPSPCYRVADVVVDGVSVGVQSSHTFSGVTADHTIAASFAPDDALAIPVAPTGLTVTNTGTSTSLAVAWMASPSLGVIGYRIYRSDGGPMAALATVSGLVYMDDAVMRNRVYTYQVAALSDCGEGPASAVVSLAPDYFPVLFVHGLCGTHDDFTDCPGAFPCQVDNATRIGDALHQLGLNRLHWVDYSQDACLNVAASTVAARIDAILSATGDAKLNIVAHSQGGLIARYLAKHGYSAKINDLVMIGTPNHGSDLSRMAALPGPNMPKVVRRYVQLVTPCLLSSDARYDLRPGSTFLNQLNYGTRTNAYDSQDLRLCAQRGAEDAESSVRYWLFHGTGFCRLPRGAVNLLGLCEPHDGVVETGALSDGDLVSLASIRKATDVGLSSSRASHCLLSAGNCVVEETQHTGIIIGVYNVLTGGSIMGSTPGAGTDDSATTTGVREGAQVAAFEDSLGQQVYHMDQTISASETVWDTIQVTSASKVSFLQTSDVDLLAFAVRSPSGALLTPADSVAAGIEVEFEPILGFQSISVASPESGSWIVESGATSEMPTQSVSVDAYVVSQASLSISVPDQFLNAGEPVGITAVLRYQGVAMVSTQMQAQLTAPDSSSTAVALFDDGQHGDGTASDGIFGGTCIGTSQVGGHAVVVEARATLSSGVAVRRIATAGFVVESLPDLAIRPEDIQIARLHPGQSDTLMVRATIRNIGAVAATNVVVDFLGASSASFAQDFLSVPAGGLATASGLWVPGRPELDTVLVYVDGASRVIQSRYDNDSARVATSPELVSVTPSVAVQSLQLAQSYPNPTRGELTIPFALPRAGRAGLGIYDVAGRLIRKVVDADLPAGMHYARWDSRGSDGVPVAAGIYFYALRLDGESTGRRLIIIR